MTDIKKDHSIGEGTGAGAGAIAGAVIGSAAGPVGTVVGAVVGAIGGSKAGGAIAEAVNPTAYNTHFESAYKSAPYYKAERSYSDIQPAYQYGYDQYGNYAGKKFEDVESHLQRDWEASKNNTNMAWNDAKGAVRDGWHYIERAMPGDADGDGR